MRTFVETVGHKNASFLFRPVFSRLNDQDHFSTFAAIVLVSSLLDETLVSHRHFVSTL